MSDTKDELQEWAKEQATELWGALHSDDAFERADIVTIAAALLSAREEGRREATETACAACDECGKSKGLAWIHSEFTNAIRAAFQGENGGDAT